MCLLANAFRASARPRQTSCTTTRPGQALEQRALCVSLCGCFGLLAIATTKLPLRIKARTLLHTCASAVHPSGEHEQCVASSNCPVLSFPVPGNCWQHCMCHADLSHLSNYLFSSRGVHSKPLVTVPPCKWLSSSCVLPVQTMFQYHVFSNQVR